MKKYQSIILSTAVPLFIVGLIAVVAYFVCGVGLAVNDCYEQYVPFFTAYYDVLTQGKSMFYSLTGSMGYDFYSVFAYYLVSPLNLLILLFGRDHIIYGVNFLIVLKIALCGTGFSVFIRQRFPKAPTSKVVLFSTIYAMSGFIIGYSWNIMWLDGVLLFPLVIFGLDLLMKDEKITRWYWYTLFLTLQLLISYSIGYMTSIFLLLFFFTYRFNHFRYFIKKLWMVGLSSLLAIGISAIILMPSFWGLDGTSIASERLPAMEFYGSYATTFQSFFLGMPANGITFDREYANLFVTTFILLLVGIYFVTRSIPWGNKIRNFLFVAFLLFSMNFKPLNFIWHGMHEQTGIPNRFSFMVIFLLLLMAFEVGMTRRKGIQKKEVLLGWGLLGVGVLVLVAFDHELWIYGLGNMALAMVYVLMILLIRGGRWRFFFTSILVYIEVIAMFILGIFCSNGGLLGDYSYYMDDFSAITEQRDAGFYREKIDETYNLKEEEFENTLQYQGFEHLTPSLLAEYCQKMKDIGHLSIVNEATVYGLHAMSLFNTFNNSAMTDFYNQTGATGGINNVMYYGENAFMDMLLGVKYYYVKEAQVNSSAYQLVETVGKVDIYQNRYSLSVGYAIPKALLEADLLESNPFTTMNNMSLAITGEKTFLPEHFLLAENDVEKDLSKTYEMVPDQEGELLVQVNGSDMEKIVFYINDQEVFTTDRNQIIYDLGMVKNTDQIRIQIFYQDTNQTVTNIYSGTLKEGALDAVYAALQGQQMKVSSYDDAHIQGSITLESASPVLITVPATTGWKVTVDGVLVELDRFCDLFMVLDLEKGTHNIKLEYSTPGFWQGAMVTLAGLMIGGIWLLITRIRIEKRKKVSE